MQPLDLIHLQITLEYQLSADGFLVPFPGSTEQARYITYEYQTGFVQYFHRDLPAVLRDQLLAAGPAAAFREPELVKGILVEHAPCQAEGVFAAHYFAHRPLPDEFPDVQLHAGCFVVKRDDRPVAWAWSERQNERCAEVAVETLPEHRRRGYARQVTAAWADQVLNTGRVAFFSHSTANQVSRALACSLEVVQFAYCAAYD